jgi:hypothetical protein
LKRVIIESPFAGLIDINKAYGRFAMHDCLVNHNESPYASHLLYTQENVLRDELPDERKLGIEAGFYWRDVSEKTIFYIDLGITPGMNQGIADCKKKSTPYELRELPDDIWDRFITFCDLKGFEKPERVEKNAIYEESN